MMEFDPAGHPFFYAEMLIGVEVGTVLLPITGEVETCSCETRFY